MGSRGRSLAFAALLAILSATISTVMPSPAGASLPALGGHAPAARAAVHTQTSTPGNVYVSNLTVKTISQYSVSPSGQLVALTPATLSVGSSLTPGELEITPDRRNLYVSLTDSTSSGNDAIGEYSIGAGGALTPLATPTVPTAGAPIEIVFTPDGKFLYVDNATGQMISQYSVGVDGALTALSPATIAPPGGEAGELTITPDGKFLYESGLTRISQYSIGADGLLTPLSPQTAGSGGTDMKVTPDSKFLYQGGRRPPSVNQYSIAADGQLTPLSPDSTGGPGALELEMTSDGHYLYATSFDASSNSQVLQFSIGSDGILTPLSPASVPTGRIGFELVVSADDAFAFVGNDALTGDPSIPDTVSQYSIGIGGQLTYLSPSTISTGAGAGALTATPAIGAASAPVPTATTYTGATTGPVGAPAPLKGRLTDSTTGLPLSGMNLHFTFNALENCDGITNSDGVASCSVTPSEPAGTYPIVVSFAGTNEYLPSSANANFVLTQATLVTTPTTPPTSTPGDVIPLPAGPTRLATTGDDIGGEVLAGFVLAVTGLFLLTTRRRLILILATTR